MPGKRKSQTITPELVEFLRSEMDARVEQMYHPVIRSQTGVTERRYHLALTLFLATLERHIGETDDIPEVRDAIFAFGMVTDNRCEFCWVEHPDGADCQNPDCPG